MPEEQVPVLIVGGGGAGLTASMLLSRLEVDHLLVSARPGTSDLPKAHVLNQRAMEILDDCGVADAIAERSTPAEQMAATGFYAGFAGPTPNYGRQLMRLESWGAGGENENWRAASAWRQLNLPQIRLEPLLKARRRGACARPHPLQPRTALARAGRGGRDRAHPRQRHRRRVPGALPVPDRRRRRPPVAGEIGVEYEGLGVVTETATLHVSADFSTWARDPDVLIRWIYSPQSGTLVVMVPMGPSAGDPTRRSG